ncbi:hypothetical protein FEFB_10960 [Fructobacillus sp. EFB-N1]|uniref:hypothetical protein n=1 Tax=Fructobacillus sp. EFB-N1 TaxID=1658766 RepID=UPI00065CF4CE|nr:hypothetical protein [Fructobacillus sp. EFB-N1]KMK53168.1 hypothetical protein FEFB_10960 [Fructobacillus sp. EFB-N1]
MSEVNNNKRLYDELLTMKVEQLKKASTFVEASLIARSMQPLVQSYIEYMDWDSRES